MNGNEPLVCIIEDELSVRESLSDLLESMGLKAQAFASADEFLTTSSSEAPSCLVLDIQLPGISGLDLQQQLRNGDTQIPIVFMTGYGDIPTSVRAMKGGAMEFLTKPVDHKVLTAAVRMALDLNREARSRQADLTRLRNRVSSLTPREREVLPLLVMGYLNKQVASALGISEVTVQIHRGRIMRKMAAPSFADLVRMCDSIGIPDDANPRLSGT